MVKVLVGIGHLALAVELVVLPVAEILVTAEEGHGSHAILDAVNPIPGIYLAVGVDHDPHTVGSLVLPFAVVNVTILEFNLTGVQPGRSENKKTCEKNEQKLFHMTLSINRLSNPNVEKIFLIKKKVTLQV